MHSFQFLGIHGHTLRGYYKTWGAGGKRISSTYSLVGHMADDVEAVPHFTKKTLTGRNMGCELTPSRPFFFFIKNQLINNIKLTGCQWLLEAAVVEILGLLSLYLSRLSECFQDGEYP